MTGDTSAPVYCWACGIETQAQARFCTECGARLSTAPPPTVAQLAFLLNEVAALKQEGLIDEASYGALHRRYSVTLERVRPSSRVTGGSPAESIPHQPAESVAEPDQSPVRLSSDYPLRRRSAGSMSESRESAGLWLGEQAPNLLLYMGAFLVVMAGLAILNIVALFPLTIAFLVAGWFVRRHPRVALAGNTYLAVGALLTPINFVGLYHLLAPEPAAQARHMELIWLAGSAYTAVFYGALARLGLGWLYAWLTGPALLSTWAAGLFLLNVPAEWAPPLFLLLALGMTAVRYVPSEHFRLVFQPAAVLFAQVIVPAAVVFSVGVHFLEDHSAVGHWALPVALGLGAVFYALPAWRNPAAQLTSLVLAGGVALGVVHALGVVEPAYFGLTVAALGPIYLAARSIPLLRQWPGSSLLWPAGIAAATLGWLPFIDAYGTRPYFAASALMLASSVYLAGSSLRGWRDEAARLVSAPTDGSSAIGRSESQTITVLLLYPAAFTLALAYYYLVRDVLGPGEVSNEAALAQAYFPFSLAIAAVGVLSWRRLPEWSFHPFIIAAGLSLFVILMSADDPGWQAGYAGVYAGVVAAAAVWRHRSAITYAALPYILIGLLGVLRAAAVPEIAWALLPAIVATGVYVAGWALKAYFERRVDAGREWGQVLRHGGLVLAAAAPAIGIGRLMDTHGVNWLVLRYLGGAAGPVDPVQTALHDASAGAMALFALFIGVEARERLSVSAALAASGVLLLAILMTILRLQPDNIQFVSLPAGLYVWGVVVILGRLARRHVTPAQREMLSLLAGAAAVLVLTPTFLQALPPAAWAYRFLLLGQGLVIFVAGVALHHRLLVAPAVAFVGLGALLQVLDIARALPGWVVMGSAGGVLLLAGLFLLLRQDLWVRWRAGVATWWSGERSAAA